MVCEKVTRAGAASFIDSAPVVAACVSQCHSIDHVPGLKFSSLKSTKSVFEMKKGPSSFSAVWTSAPSFFNLAVNVCFSHDPVGVMYAVNFNLEQVPRLT